MLLANNLISEVLWCTDSISLSWVLHDPVGSSNILVIISDIHIQYFAFGISEFAGVVWSFAHLVLEEQAQQLVLPLYNSQWPRFAPNL